MLKLARRGVPYPFLITPRTDQEARSGKATLLTDGQLEILLHALGSSPKWNDPELATKLESLRDGG